VESKASVLKCAVIILYFCVIVVNALSFIMPVNGSNVAQIASYYPNYFTPYQHTFIIWIAIYFLLAAFSLYQYKEPDSSHISNSSLNMVRIGFILYCIFNFIWLISWQFDYFALSTVIILAATAVAGIICRNISKSDLSAKDVFFVKIPFGMVYGWLGISTVVNLVILMYSTEWKIMGLPYTVLAILTFILVAVFASVQTLINKDMAYCLTVIWSYIGILIKHIINENLDRPYPYAEFALVISIVLLACSLIYLTLEDRIVHKHWY